MSLEETNNDREAFAGGGEGAADRENASVANKLSKELTNWRKRRTQGGGQGRHENGPNASFQSDAARTIKVRGHETLVVRKGKVMPKPSASTGDSGR